VGRKMFRLFLLIHPRENLVIEESTRAPNHRRKRPTSGASPR
jgi:hypothetical protein